MDSTARMLQRSNVMKDVLPAAYTQAWGLLEQLALSGQQDRLDEPLARHAAMLLQHYLHVSAGMIVLLDGKRVTDHASWGMNAEQEDRLLQHIRSTHPEHLPPPLPEGIFTPLRSGEVVIGYLLLGGTPEQILDRSFYDALVAQLSLLVQLERRSMANARTLQHKVGELSMLLESSRLLTSARRTDEVLATLSALVHRQLDVATVALWRLGKDQKLYPVVIEGMLTRPIEEIRVPIGHGLSGRVAALRQPLMVEDVFEDGSSLYPDFNRVNRLVSFLGTPVLYRDNLVGVITVMTTTRRAFRMDEVALLQGIADQTAIALENARLFDEMTALANDLEDRVYERTAALEASNRQLGETNEQLATEKYRMATLHAVTLELTSTFDLDEIITRSLEIASANLGVSRGSIMLRDPQKHALVCRAVLDDKGLARPAQIPITFNNDRSLAHWVLTNQRSVMIPDVRDDDRWVVEQGRADEVRSVLATPLVSSDVPLGVLVLGSPHVGYFTDAHLRLLETIANQVSIAINNAQLYSYIAELAAILSNLLGQQREEASKSTAILKSLTEGVLMLNTQQRFTQVNPAAEYMLGLKAQQLMEQPLERIVDMVGSDQRDRYSVLLDAVREGIAHAQERRGSYTSTLELIEPTQIFVITFAPVDNAHGMPMGIVSVMRDVTREIEADRAKREFISRVSHELRTPLTAIKGYAEVMLGGATGELNEDQQVSLQIIRNNSRKLMELINDILDISRFEAGNMPLNLSDVVMSDVITDVLDTLRIEVERKSLAVSLRIEPDLPTAEADSKRLTQVIANLVSNAIKYTFPNGSITINAFLTPAQLMQVDVQDTGVGMTATQLERLFVPFYRADNPLSDEAGGTGLGLSIAKSLIEQHHGKLWVRSEQGKGSTFSFAFPLRQPSEVVS